MFQCDPSIYYVPVNLCISLLISTAFILSCFFLINKIIWRSYNKYFCKYQNIEMIIIPCKKNFYSSLFFYVINSITAVHLILIPLVTYNTVCAPESKSTPYWREKAIVFLVEYIVSLTLCLGRKLFNERIKLTFILPSNLYDCNYVCTWVKEQADAVTFRSDNRTLSQSFISLFKKIAAYINDEIEGFSSFNSEVLIDENSGIRYFVAGSNRYVFSSEKNAFLPQIQSNNVPITELMKVVESGGQCESSIISYLSIFGKNEYPVHIESLSSILKNCFYNSTFILQYLMLSTTFFLRFYTWSVCWSFLILYTNTISFIREYLKNKKIISEINLVNSRLVRVKRQNEIKMIKSSDIVLYDIIFLEPEEVIPCDTILVNGNALVDESNLTGESIPIFKKSLDFTLYKDESFSINDKNVRDSILYAGSKILKVYKLDNQSSITSIALNTGLFTFKSKIINGLLQQERNAEEFHNDIPFLWLITMLISFVIIIIQCFISSVNIGSLFFVLGTFMQLLPIWAPAFVQSCINTSMSRLKKEFGIYSSSPKRIFFGSKLNTLFFDKTGTLTELEYCLSHVEKLNISILQENHDVDILRMGISTCHALSLDPDDNENYYGDAIEREMLKYSKSRIIERRTSENNKFKRFIVDQEKVSNNNQDNDWDEITKEGFEIIKIFDFNGINKSMSVIVQCKITGRVFLFSKGASESIVKYSSEFQIPKELSLKLSKYSSSGNYVLLLAFRELNSDTKFINEYMNSKEQDRFRYETDLVPIGILCFSNNIRTEACSVIKEIRELGIQPVVLTGDNSECALDVARQVGIIQDYEDEKLLSGKDHLSINFLRSQKVVLVHVMNKKLVFLNENREKISIQNIFRDLENTRLVLTYEAFELMSTFDIGSTNIESEILNKCLKNCNLIDKSIGKLTLQDLLIKNISVISRSNHINKLDVVKQFMYRGNIVGMVGDGSNDIAALRQSNIGIFTSNNGNINSHFVLNNGDLKGIINIIFEGCGSAATSRSLYLFMILYGFTIVICKNILLYTGQATLPVMGYFYYSILVNFPGVWSLKKCRPAKKMKSYPVDSGLVSRTSILTVFCFIFIIGFNLSILMFTLSKRDWFVSSYTRNLSIPIYLFARQDGFESATTLIWMCSLHSHMALIFGFGGDHREPFYKNLWLVISWLCAQLGLIFILFSAPSVLTCLFRVNCMESLTPANIYHLVVPKFVGNNVFPFSWKLELFGWIVLSFLLSVLFYLRINRRRISRNKSVI